MPGVHCAAAECGAAAALREQFAGPMLDQEQVEYDQELTARTETLEGKAFEETWLAGSSINVNQVVD